MIPDDIDAVHEGNYTLTILGCGEFAVDAGLLFFLHLRHFPPLPIYSCPEFGHRNDFTFPVHFSRYIFQC